MIIGIPRALLYWKRPGFWQVFFESLGCKVLLSPPTNKEIIEMGTKAADPETCFSIKVFLGHLLWLDKKVDYIFVPRLKADKNKLEYCPKFFALPDLAKLLTETPILTEDFDYRKMTIEKTLMRLGKKLGKSKKETERAMQIAFSKEKELLQKQTEGFLEKVNPQTGKQKPKIILVSHPYNLYDKYVNLGVEEKLQKLGAEVIFIDEIVPKKRELETENYELKNNGQKSSWPEFHWEFGREIGEKIEQVFNYNIAGAIEISSFQCGCDAVLKEFVEREFRQRKIPFLYLIIDEQSGEAGFQTRLEAFMDTLK